MAVSKRNPMFVAFQKLLRERVPHDKRLQRIDLLREGQDDDRAAALVATSLLEQALQDAISTHFVPLEPETRAALFEGNQERDAMLGSLYQLALLALALGIVGKETHQDLNQIRRIRNVFAHAPGEVSFRLKDIGDACNLSVCRRFDWRLFPGKAPVMRAGGSIERDRFPATIYLFVFYLGNITEGESQPKTYRNTVGGMFFA